MQIWHLTFSSANRLPPFPTPGHRLEAARCIARVGAGRVLMFELPDDHGHVMSACREIELPSLRSALTRALTPIAVVPIAASHVQPVRSRVHLLRNVRYFLTQSEHHGIARPLLDPGSCFQDLVGARILPGFEPAALKRAAPRLTRADLLAIVKLPESALSPATPADLRRVGVSAIVRVAAEAVGAKTDLADRTAATVLARRAAVHTTDLSDLSRRDLRTELQLSARAIRRLAHEPIDSAVLRAVRLRVSIEESLGALIRAA